MADFLIVGGGVIGLSMAYHLARQGALVTVLDAGMPGQASSAAAGMLAPLAEATGPGPFLDMALESLRCYPDFVAALQDDSGINLPLNGPGMLRVARTEAEDAALCQALSWQSALGLPLHRLTGDDVRRLEPCAAPTIRSAILSPAERHIEPRRLLAALSAACRRVGVQIHSDSPATEIETVEGRAAAVLIPTGLFPCGTLVLASGAWSGACGRQLGVNVPITPLRGQILALGPRLPLPLHHTLYTHGAYLVPRADGRIVAGATEEGTGFAAETTPEGIARLRSDAARLAPVLADWPLDSAWAGLRPVSADGLPLLGRLPGWENVHIAAGHGRNGILLTPITGQWLADYLLHAAPLPAAFDPARFGEAQ